MKMASFAEIAELLIAKKFLIPLKNTKRELGNALVLCTPQIDDYNHVGLLK